MRQVKEKLQFYKNQIVIHFSINLLLDINHEHILNINLYVIVSIKRYRILSVIAGPINPLKNSKAAK